MAILDHWHPVLRSKQLRAKPVGVRIAGKGIALFRTKSGNVGALDDCCLHRRMRLSCGQVVDDRLRCRYHGWTFSTDGLGESPGTPKLQANTVAYDTAERFGVLWLKSRAAEPAFPQFVPEGYYHLCTLHHHIKA